MYNYLFFENINALRLQTGFFFNFNKNTTKLHLLHSTCILQANVLQYRTVPVYLPASPWCWWRRIDASAPPGSPARC